MTAGNFRERCRIRKGEIRMIYEAKGTKQVAELFAGWQETMVWSCLQGVMGRLYADAEERPGAVMAILGDFCFFAGAPNRELAAYRPDWRRQDFIIMTANSPDWFEMIESVYGDKAKKVSRYAMKKEEGAFDREKLLDLASAIDSAYRLQMMDQEWFSRCKEQEWSRDFVSLYADYEEYRRIGLGVVALKGGELVAGASSYSSYQGGIEIEIDTKEEYRRQGLATACGARLVLECLDRGLYPSWDAQNLWSAALAEKLGYHLDHEYTAYEITEYDFFRST